MKIDHESAPFSEKDDPPGRRPPPPLLLRAVDRAAFVVSLSARLQRAGVSVGFTGMGALARAMTAAPLDSRSSLYWATRICLVQRQSDLGSFDAVFAAIFDESVGLDPHARSQPLRAVGNQDTPVSTAGASSSTEEGDGLPWATLPSVTSTTEAEPAGLALPERLPNGLEGLADTPFDELDTEQLALLSGWLESALASWPTRRTRRQSAHHAGRRTALRPTLARARRTGWEPIELVRTRPVRKHRRVVMLCDVSQSMQCYAAAYLHLMRAVALTTDAEVFAFGTTLTRLTSVLVYKSPQLAMQQATEKVADRFGGTRIASNIRALLASRHGGVTRGAIMIIASDGWDSDPPAELARVMARLHRRAYQVLWLNPRAAAPDFAPLVAGFAAALPYCDYVLPAHNIRALGDVVSAIVRAGRSDVVSSKG
jgi:uncharacterized protein with von Willebrand factor type A (vWA) domain